MIGFLIYIIGGIIAFFLLVLILKDAPKTEEDNYENSVVYACGFSNTSMMSALFHVFPM